MKHKKQKIRLIPDELQEQNSYVLEVIFVGFAIIFIGILIGRFFS